MLRGGTLVTMDGQRRVLRGDVLIEGGKITAIGEVDASTDAEVIDVTDKHVLPGLIQGHVHLGQALLRGLAEGRELMDWLRDRVWPLEAAHNADSAYWSAMLGAADCLLAGTTTIQEIGLVTQMESIYRGIDDAGMRAVAGKCLMDSGDGVPTALAQPPEDSLHEAVELAQSWAERSNGRITGSLCPRFILSCSEALWRGTVERSTAHDLPIHTHLLEHPDEEQEVRGALGTGQMEYLDRVGVLDRDLRIAHGVQFAAPHREILAGRPLRVTHCPSANLKLGSGIADLRFLAETPGVELGIGCDGAPCNNDMDVLEEIRLAALLQGIRQRPGAFSSEQALALATCGGAAAIGLAEQIGSISVGKAADLVVVDLERPASFGPHGVSIYDRIVYGAARDAVCWVLVGGEVRVDHGTLPHMDAGELARRPAEEIESLLRRAELA